MPVLFFQLVPIFSLQANNLLHIVLSYMFCTSRATKASAHLSVQDEVFALDEPIKDTCRVLTASRAVYQTLVAYMSYSMHGRDKQTLVQCGYCPSMPPRQTSAKEETHQSGCQDRASIGRKQPCSQLLTCLRAKWKVAQA